ncbi:MAG: glycosyltransferase [Sarcina sp.]
MNILIDGLNYFLHNGEYGEHSRAIINSINEISEANIILVKDNFINKNSNIQQLELSIDRFTEEYKFNTRKKFDVFHCFNNGFYINNNIKAKRVFSISSLLPLIDENLCSTHYLKRFNERINDAIDFSHAIIVTSNYQKNILEKYFKKAKNKIHLFYPSISSFYNNEKIEISYIYVKSKFSLNSKYILFSGDLHRRKNIEDVLFFYKILKERGILDYKLVIVLNFIHNNSYETSYLNELKNLVELLNIGDSTIFFDNATEYDLIHLFKSASKYIDFSIAEDFNLSILKAFVCDLDIICTKTELNIELLGDYPNYYEFEENTIINLFTKSKSEEEKEKFDYLRDNYRGNYSYNQLINLYQNLKEVIYKK